MNNIIEKANYCLGCVNKPCQKGCPLNNDTMGFIKLVKENKYKEAYELLCETTVLQSICGRICPHEKQCQGSCIRSIKGEPVKIGKIEAFIGDLAIKNNWKIPNNSNMKKNKKIAVIGGGPSGLTCAAYLAREGYNVTIYEKREKLGGILYYGIPEFRLSKEIVNKTIEKIIDLGIKVKNNCELGKDVFLNELEKNYDAIYLGFGANKSLKMNIPGENLDGVFGANELLEYNVHPSYENKNVAVIGGGNVAIDIARVINKLGAKTVTIIYRRSENEMPANKVEIKDAKNEGVKFLFQNNILKIIGEEKVEKIECIKTELIKKENEDRLIPVDINDSNYFLNVDFVMMAIGSKADEDITEKLKLDTIEKGKIKIDGTNKTSNRKIFAGGDLVGEKQTVAWASNSGKNAAKSIIVFLNEQV